MKYCGASIWKLRHANPELPAASTVHSEGFDWYFLAAIDVADAGTLVEAEAQNCCASADDVFCASTLPAMLSRSQAVTASCAIIPMELAASAVLALAVYLLTP